MIQRNELINKDCLDAMKSMEDNSVDAIVTDPPYGLSFMGKKWDYDVPSKEIWIEALRVLKPGGHLLSFGGTRTYHRMVVAIEDAGFEIRDQIQWLYGSGFPKSTDVSKRIDKEAGADRKITGRPKPGHEKFIGKQQSNFQQWDRPALNDPEWQIKYHQETAPATEEAKQWEGWGTALKPANEPIVLARKPLEKGLTVAENVLKYGTGALNIDDSRISTDENLSGGAYSDNREVSTNEVYGEYKRMKPADYKQPQGRWPANIILDETAAEMLDEQQENVSRFFYVAKASKSERNRGCEEMPEKEWKDQGFRDNESTHKSPRAGAGRTSPNSNHHPTVKPIKLMSYLCKLITPPNGTVLDPFMGSGSTGVACKELGFNFIGIEMNPEYFEIAKNRCK